MVTTVFTKKAVTVDPVEELWNLIQNQSTSVRETLIKRIMENAEEEKKRKQEKNVKKSLETALKELKDDKTRSVEDFLSEL